jgi:hypothetical protein
LFGLDNGGHLTLSSKPLSLVTFLVEATRREI